MKDFLYIQNNLNLVKENIEKAKKIANTKDVSLLAVTKSATNEEVAALLSFGINAIGENRTSLFKERFSLAKSLGYQVETHLIGSLQTNKVKDIIADASLIQSVDRLSLLVEIEKQASKIGRVKVPILLEINSGREENKGGILPENAEGLLLKALEMPHISVRGLMTMAPDCENRDDYHHYFSETRELFQKLHDIYSFGQNPILSMGMSNSYDIAIMEGANLVRIGRTLFKQSLED